MEEKKEVKVSISTLLLILSIIIIIVMSVFIYKMYKEKEEINNEIIELNSQIESLQVKINTLKSNIDTISNSADNTTKTTNTADNNSTNSKEAENENINSQENKTNDIIGRWNTFAVYDSKNNTSTENLADVFGSAYSRYGSYLDLKQDGTFLNSIQPVTNGDTSIEGTYEIKENYYKAGDRVIFLHYNDGREEEYRLIYQDENNTPVLANFYSYNNMQYSLKK